MAEPLDADNLRATYAARLETCFSLARAFVMVGISAAGTLFLLHDLRSKDYARGNQSARWPNPRFIGQRVACSV